ncbi:transcription factor [Clostridium botulinum D/C]|nr:transcription factor [Clostridium botulinum C/D str. BKT75002]KEI13414.1 transcription factor [Clostridium botulinum C/D str. BKT2873]MCD3351433.1 transcription factor [Clostridium botulinum D/C]QPW61216.1 transcription factor [Clostridium botulinum]MCD3360389.1 transcription factor [Clostridium botulinum D/C]
MGCMNNLVSKSIFTKHVTLIEKIKISRIEKIKDKNTKKIIKYSICVKENITNENVVKYIRFIKNIDIPNTILCKSAIIDVYKSIKDSENIKDNLKSDLRILLGCKGITFVY